MSRFDPSKAPRFRLSPTDGARLAEILQPAPAADPVPVPASADSRTRPRTRTDRRRGGRWRWFWITSALLLGTLGLAVVLAPAATEGLARQVLAVFGSDTDALLTRLSELAQAAGRAVRVGVSVVVDTITSITERAKKGTPDP